MAVPKKNKTQPPATVQNFPIVGIGASAGGLDAFKRLLKSIPENSGMAYVLVQHLDPTHESFLPEILQRVTKIPVHEITEDIHLAPDHIYIIPSNKILTSTDGVLQLTPRVKKILNLSIDVFFTSLADVHKEFAVGVVLSGTGNDGTKGLKAIKEQGGITIAQDLESASYNAMPQSAIDAGVVDFILPPDKIPQQLLQINSIDKTTVAQTVVTVVPKDDENIFKQILTIIRLNSGVDFTYYKQPTPRRRIARRMAICKTSKLSGYLKILRNNKAEQDALFQDMLIPVTSFFRDTKTFHDLNTTIIPLLLKNKSADEPIRVWIAGCSTGEEAYSIAICLHECCTEKLAHTRIQIFASDISEVAIKKARTGIYTKADVETLTDARLKTYFIKNNGGYEVSKLIRDMCVFAPHNFLKDPPFAKMDLISCRNSLIYMDTFLQKKALSTFHYALKEKGFLLLGKSETTGASSDLFAPVSKHEKFYSRKSMPGRFMHVATERKEE
ncbi:MAG: chemotaxis protein CheB, partial [Bacteroidia bacterium]